MDAEGSRPHPPLRGTLSRLRRLRSRLGEGKSKAGQEIPDGRAETGEIHQEGVVALRRIQRHELRVGAACAQTIGNLLLLLQRDATVTICHSRTKDLPAVAATADILVAAIGRPGFVTPAFVKPGAAVVDVGINPITVRQDVVALFGEQSPRVATFDSKGSVIAGDVHPAVADVAGALSPVPGGVGPLTIAMLLKNTLTAAETRRP